MLFRSLNKALIIPNGVDIYKIGEIEKQVHIKCRNTSTSIRNKIILFAAEPYRKSKNFNLANFAVNKINGNLKVVYNVSNEKIVKEMLLADVLLLTSLWEGSPNIVKEAMVCNCPIVATDVGNVRWLFGNEPGYFITSFDPEDVVDKIKQALEFSEKHGRTNGRQRIIELGLDSETVANKIIGVYEEVLQKRSQ